MNQSRFGPNCKKNRGPSTKLPFTYAQKEEETMTCFSLSPLACINVNQILGCIISCWAFASSIMHTCRYKYPNVEVLLTSIFCKYRPFAFLFDEMVALPEGVTKAIWILKIYGMPRVTLRFPPFIAWPSYKMLGFPWRFGGAGLKALGISPPAALHRGYGVTL